MNPTPSIGPSVSAKDAASAPFDSTTKVEWVAAVMERQFGVRSNLTQLDRMLREVGLVTGQRPVVRAANPKERPCGTGRPDANPP